MDLSVGPAASAPVRRLSDRAFYALAVALAFATYFLVFLVVGRDVRGAALSSLVNLTPLLVVAAAARAIVTRYLLHAPWPRQLAGHGGLAALFTILWYWLLMVLIGVREGGSFTEFVVKNFWFRPAVTWQLLQGVTVYALLAALTHLRAREDLPSFILGAESTTDAKEPGLSRYFIRRGEDIFPVDVSQIVSIAGADDYAEVVTLEGRHLVRTTLAEFEASLDPTRFIRVHRSRIVNLDRIERAEPAGGGRMLLHMADGETVQASRAGSRLLRDRVI